MRQQLAAGQKLPFNTRQNSATEILSVCLAFGCNSEVSLEGPDGSASTASPASAGTIRAKASRCWASAKKHVAPRIGYGYQQHPGEFLAMLAMSRVPTTIRSASAGTTHRVADLVEAEKLGCRSGSDMSLKLIGLAYYVAEPQWKNDLGETWSIERMIDDELDQPIDRVPDGGLNRLLGLSYAVARRAKTRPADRRAVPAGAKVHRQLPGVRPATCKTPTEVGARTSLPPGTTAPMPPSQLRLDRPRAGMAGHLAARGRNSTIPA